MAEIWVVENIRVFSCNKPEEYDGMESDYKGLFMLNVHDTVHMGRPRPRTYSPNLWAEPFYLEGLCVLLDQEDDLWFTFSDTMLGEFGLFKQTDRLAREISLYLKSFFRFQSGMFDSIVIVVDIAKAKGDDDLKMDDDDLKMNDGDLKMDDGVGMIDTVDKEIIRVARWWWGEEGRDMEMEEVKAGIVRMNKREEYDCECCICLNTLAEKVAENDKLKRLVEKQAAEMVMLKCGHVFHHGCIFNWLPKHHSCPYCRSSTLTIV